MKCIEMLDTAYKGLRKHAWKLRTNCLCQPSDTELQQGDARRLSATLVGLKLGIEAQIKEALLGGNIAIEQDGAD